MAFSLPALKIIAEGLKNERKCQIEVDELKQFIDRKHDARQELHWWQEPQAVVGGITVSFVLGGLIVWGHVPFGGNNRQVHDKL